MELHSDGLVGNLLGDKFIVGESALTDWQFLACHHVGWLTRLNRHARLGYHFHHSRPLQSLKGYIDTNANLLEFANKVQHPPRIRTNSIERINQLTYEGRRTEIPEQSLRVRCSQMLKQGIHAHLPVEIICNLKDPHCDLNLFAPRVDMLHELHDAVLSRLGAGDDKNVLRGQGGDGALLTQVSLDHLDERLKLVRGDCDHGVVIKTLAAVGYVHSAEMFETVINLNLPVRTMEGRNVSRATGRRSRLGGKSLFSIDLMLTKDLGPILPRAHPPPIRQLNNLV